MCGREMQSLGLTLLALGGIPGPSPSAFLGITHYCAPGSYLQSGAMKDNTLSQTHTLAQSHPLPNGDIGAQLWRGPSNHENGGTWGCSRSHNR